MVRTSPLFNHSPGDHFAWTGQQPIAGKRFLADVRAVAKHLPSAQFAVNLCANRYLFTVGFAAVLTRGQTNLLPCSRIPHDVASARAVYPDNYILTDEYLIRSIRSQFSPVAAYAPPSTLAIADTHCAAITFTSGSTGQSQPYPKTWGSLVRCARVTQQRFALTAPMALLATVPPQHMYGLETSVMLPLISGSSIHRERPLYPEDIRSALLTMPPPRVLITTPVHLRACCQTAADWPEVHAVISATAPLSTDLAAAAETLFQAPVMEIYGCTEGGTLATRRTVEGNRWQLLEGIQIAAHGCEHWVNGGHLAAPLALNDLIEPIDTDTFRLLGRHSDMVNIAGKRASLSSLNHHLNAIEGVLDGAFIMPALLQQKNSPEQTAPQRLVAFVVAPELSTSSILTALAERIDVAFLPRPLYRIERLPRNETGKLPQRELLALLQRLKKHA